MADARREAADGFEVVIENLRFRREHEIDGRVTVLKIGNQNFDDDAGIQFADFFNRLAKMLRAAVRHVVAGDGGDDDVFQFHPACGLGHAERLIGFERERFGRGHGAKAAGARAAVAGNHERRRAFAPAFPMVRALGALADRVQLEFAEQVARLRKRVGRGQLDAQPFRQTRAGFQFSRRHFNSFLATD